MRPHRPSSVSVFTFSDYRAYLKEAYEEYRKGDSKFSHRFISGHIGTSSSGWFSDILKGRVNLTSSHLVKVADLFRLNDIETDFFEILVQFNQAGSIEEKNRLLKKLLAFKEMKVDLVGQEKFEYYSKWYHSAVRELLFFHDFQGDFATLARKLNPPIKASQAKDSIRLLEVLGFIQKDPQGRLRPLTATLKKDTTFKSLYTANYLKANMDLGMLALEKFPKEKRHVSTMTLSYSDAGFQKALVEIEALRKKLVALMDEDGLPDKAFQLNLQLFPVTQ